MEERSPELSMGLHTSGCVGAGSPHLVGSAVALRWTECGSGWSLRRWSLRCLGAPSPRVQRGMDLTAERSQRARTSSWQIWVIDIHTLFPGEY